MKKVLVLCIVVLAISIGAAFSYPSLLGPTGGAALPVANVIPAGQWNLAADFYNHSGGGLDASIPIRVLYGLGNRVEIGAIYTLTDGDDSWGVNGKILTSSLLGGFNWSIGGVFERFNSDSSAIQAYVVGTRVLIPGNENYPSIRGSIGLNWTLVDIFDDDANAFRPFFNVDLGFNTGTNVTAEYQFKNSDIDSDALASIVVRHMFTPRLSGQAGFTNAIGGIAGTNDFDLLVGINYKMTTL